MNRTIQWKIVWLCVFAVLTLIGISSTQYYAMATPESEVTMQIRTSSTAESDVLTLSIDTADSVAALGFDVVFDGTDPNLVCTEVADGVNCNPTYGSSTARINRVSYANPLNSAATLVEIELDCDLINSATITNAQFVNNDLEPINLTVETNAICTSAPLHIGFQIQEVDNSPTLGIVATLTLFVLLLFITHRLKTVTLIIPMLFGVLLLSGSVSAQIPIATPIIDFFPIDFPTATEPGSVMGDTNCDGFVTIVDALLADQYAAGAKTGQYLECPSDPRTAMYLPACDVNLTGDCTAEDISQLVDCDIRFDNQFCNETSQYVLVVTQFNSTSSPGEVSASGEVVVETEDGEEVSNNAFSLTTQLWESGEVPVCWINPASANAAERGWVQQAVADTWEANSQVRFTGWGTCPNENDFQSVRIKIDESGPRVRELGRVLRFRDEGMYLNFGFTSWSTGCSGPESYRQFCIEAIAVHEFGHVLGFAHEQNRPDTPSWCDDEQGTDGDVLIGDWDADSIMNYCNPAWNNDGRLSAGDIAAVQRYYGEPVPPVVTTPTVCLEGELDINDDETFGNEFAEYLINSCAQIAPNTTHTFRVSKCAGDEVRVELEAVVSVATDFTAVGTVQMDLYEGTSCDTTDFETSGTLSLSSPLNGAGDWESRRLDNPEGGDWTNARLRLTVASTDTPVTPTNTPTPPQTVCLEGSMELNDDETFGSDERGTFTINECSNMVRGTTQTFHVSECVGDEVRGEVTVVVTFRNDGSASGEVTIELFEGTSCSTNDLEITRVGTLTTPPNSIGSSWNTRLDSGGDWGEFSLFLSVAP